MALGHSAGTIVLESGPNNEPFYIVTPTTVGNILPHEQVTQQATTPQEVIEVEPQGPSNEIQKLSPVEVLQPQSTDQQDIQAETSEVLNVTGPDVPVISDVKSLKNQKKMTIKVPKALYAEYKEGKITLNELTARANKVLFSTNFFASII